MDASQSSREKNNSSPSLATLTRSRSQIFFHRSRSGLLRPDSGRRHKPYELPSSRRCSRHRSSESDVNHDDVVLEKRPCKKMKPNQEPASSAGEEDELSRALMKDLRSRRVYSPQSSAGACSTLVNDVFSRGSGEDSNVGDRRLGRLGFSLKHIVEHDGCVKEGSKVEVENDNLGEVLSSESQKKDDEENTVLRLVLNEYRSNKDCDLYADDETESSDLGLSPEAQNSEPGNADTLDESRKLQDGKQIIGVSLEKVCDPTEELVQTTPPDAVICVDSEVKEDEEKRFEEAHVNDTLVAGNAGKNPSKGSCPKDSQRNYPIPKNKSVLRPRLPGKLFKAPGSVSFRRLFPFLKDIMGVGSGMPKMSLCPKDEKGMDGQESKLPLSSQSHEASKHEPRIETPSMSNACQSGVSEGGAVVTPVEESCHGNESKLGSSHYLLESPMQLPTKEVSREHLCLPSMKAGCLSESKADSIADFYCVQEVGNAMRNDDLKQEMQNNSLDYMKATNHGGCTSEQFGVLDEECTQTTPPETNASDKSDVNFKSGSSDLYSVKVMDKGRSNQENVDEAFCLKTDNRKESIVKRKSVPRSNLHRKLFKNPGSVNYNRLLPYLMDFNRDEYGHQTHHNKDEVHLHSKEFQLPITSLSQEASIVEHKIDSGPLHGKVEFNALVNDILVDPIVEMSHSNHPRLTSSQDLPEVVHECLSSPAVNEHVEKVEIGSGDECPSDLKFDPDSVMVVFQSVDDVPNALHKDGLEQVLNTISGEHNNESPPKAQNVLHINGNVSSLTFEHHASKENGFSIDCDERKQNLNLEKCESVGKYLPEGHSLDNMESNAPGAEDNEDGDLAICSSDDAVVLNHVSISNEESRPSSEKIILEKSDMAGHGVREAGSVLKGIVYGPKMPSKRSSNKTANRVGVIGSSSESTTTLVINRCSRMKLLKHAGSLNYKRMLPYLMDSLEDNSGASANDHCPKVQKCLDQTPLLPISDSHMRVTPASDSTGCVPMEQCPGSSRTHQQTGLRACDSNDDSSIPIPQVLESRLSYDSWKVVQPHGERVVPNGRYQLESSEEATPLGPIVNGAITKEEASSASPVASIYSEVRGNSSSLISPDGEKPPVTHECFQSLSQETVLEKPRVSAIGFKKGILKRNPRGCRGLCTCLNCASFRLHAERAFEFSRNQFLDAEEVAQDLMKELSHLRNILEGSDDSVNNNPVSEVKEACRKALVAEQLAKDRFSHMNTDLSIHCRISNLQRPRVRFSDHVEEKIFEAGR